MPTYPTLVGMKKISLGPLEQEVMSCVWEHESTTAREVYECLSKKKEIAYNTIQTIMTRLTSKGILKRKIQGKTHIYHARQTKKIALTSVIRESMSSFVNQFGEEALVAFVDGVDDISEETKKHLINKLKEK